MRYANVLVTGASSGIGRGLAALLARQGSRVYAAARRAALLERLASEVGGGRIVPVELDVADADRTHARVRELDSESGGLDLVVANAGVGVETPGRRIEWETVRRTIDVNVAGASATLVGAIPGMIARGAGHLVGISSLAAFAGFPRTGAYCASKAFLATFLASLRVDLKPVGIKVTSIHPGYVKSEMTARNKFTMPFLLETEDAVNRIWKAIERGEEVVSFPWQMAAALKTLTALPRPLAEAALRRMG